MIEISEHGAILAQNRNIYQKKFSPIKVLMLIFYQNQTWPKKEHTHF